MLMEEYLKIEKLPETVRERAEIKVDLFFRLLYDRALRNEMHESDWANENDPKWMNDLLGQVDFDRLQIEAQFRIRNLKSGSLRMEQNLPATEKALERLFRAEPLEPYYAYAESKFFWDEPYPNLFEAFCEFMIHDFTYRIGMDWLRDLVRYEYGLWSYQYFAKYKSLSKYTAGILEKCEFDVPESYKLPFSMNFDYDVLEISKLLSTNMLPKQFDKTATSLLLYQNENSEVKMSRIKQRRDQ